MPSAVDGLWLAVMIRPSGERVERGPHPYRRAETLLARLWHRNGGRSRGARYKLERVL